MAVNATVNDAQLTTKIRGILNAWAFSDTQYLGFGTDTNATMGYDGTFMRGPNPGSSSNMWNNAPSESYSDMSVAGVHKDDFFRFVTGDWTITETGAGGTIALSSTADKASNGVLILTTDVLDDDSEEMQFNAEMWDIESATAGKKIWFETRLQISEATQLDALVGLCITDSAAIDGVTDGIYFTKDDGDTNWDFASIKDSGESESASIGTAVADTWVRLGFHYDGAGTLTPYFNGTAGSTITTNLPDDEQLTITLAVQNGDGNARTMHVDYVKVVQTR